MLLEWKAQLNRMSAHGCVLVDDIPIGVMLDVEAVAALVPVVKDLAAKNVATNAPRKLVAFFEKVFMSEELCESFCYQ